MSTNSGGMIGVLALLAAGGGLAWWMTNQGKAATPPKADPPAVKGKIPAKAPPKPAAKPKPASLPSDWTDEVLFHQLQTLPVGIREKTQVVSSDAGTPVMALMQVRKVTWESPKHRKMVIAAAKTAVGEDGLPGFGLVPVSLTRSTPKGVFHYIGVGLSAPAVLAVAKSVNRASGQGYRVMVNVLLPKAEVARLLAA